MYLGRFRVDVSTPMDMCAVFNSKERVSMFLGELVKLASSEIEEAAVEGRIPPVFYYRKTHCYGVDYRLFLHAMIDWMVYVGGGKREEVEDYFSYYFLPRNNAHPFSRKLLVNFIFGEVYRVVNTLNNRDKFLDLPYYAPVVFDMDADNFTEVMAIFIYREKLELSLEKRKDLLDVFSNNVEIYCSEKPVGIGARYSAKMRENKTVHHAYSILTTRDVESSSPNNY